MRSPKDHNGGSHRDSGRGNGNERDYRDRDRGRDRGGNEEDRSQSRYGRGYDYQKEGGSRNDYRRQDDRRADDRRQDDRRMDERRDDRRDNRSRRSRSRDNSRGHSRHGSSPDRRDKYVSSRDYAPRPAPFERSASDGKNLGQNYNSVPSHSEGGLGPRQHSSQSQQQQHLAQEDSSKIPTVVSSQNQQGKQSRPDVRVRELWVGNLPEGITKEIIYSHFFIFGEIEAIELNRQHKSYPYYAFIRFKLTNCTKRAFDQTQNLEIDGTKIKVQFSDYNKRPASIVGDVPDYDLTAQNCCTLFVAFSVNSQLPAQALIEQIFCNYGKVRAIWMKQTEPNTQYRPHFFVDYQTPQEAQRAKMDIYDNDRLGVKRKQLGDKSCEILLAIRKRNKDFNNPNAYQHLSHTQFQQSHTRFQQPQLQYQPGQQLAGAPTQAKDNTLMQPPAISQQQFTQAQPLVSPSGQTQALPQASTAQDNYHPIVKQLMQMPVFKQMMVQNPEIGQRLIQEIQQDPSPIKVQHVLKNAIETLQQKKQTQQPQGLSLLTMQQVPQQQQPSQLPMGPGAAATQEQMQNPAAPQQQQPQVSPAMPEKQSTTSILDLIKKSKQSKESETPQEAQQAGFTRAPEARQTQKLASDDIFEDDDRNVWSGFVTRNKAHRVLMEAYVVGDLENNSVMTFLSDQDHNLNVSHRTNFEDVERYQAQGVVAFIPQNNTQERQFQEYIDYFTEKQRAGLCFLRNGVMFLLPPGETSARYFKNESKRSYFMVGVFGDAQAAAAQQARFNTGYGHNNNNMNK